MIEAHPGTPPRFGRVRRRAGAITAFVVLLAAAGWLVAPDRFLATWLAAFFLWTGLALGGLAILMLGHLLHDPWLGPVRSELETGARLFPLLGLAGIPLWLNLPDIYPWAAPGAESDPLVRFRRSWLSQDFFLIRTAAYFAVWSSLGWWLTRPGDRHRRASAIGLVLLVPTAILANTDWVMSLDTQWLSSLYGIAQFADQMVGATALAVLVAALRPDREPSERIAGLSGVLLILIAISAYLTFSHYLIVWSGNLPSEVFWYLARSGPWWWLVPGVSVPATVLAVLLLLSRRARKLRPVLLAAAGLLLAQHVARVYWQVRPATADGTLHWLDPVSLAAFGALCLTFYVRALKRATSMAVRRKG